MSYCDQCQNTGWIDCHCGGDLCVCENNGEYPCPNCDALDDEDWPLPGAEAVMRRTREQALLRKELGDALAKQRKDRS